MTDIERKVQTTWPERAYGLAALGALIGLIIHILLSDGSQWHWTHDHWRWTAAIFCGVAGIVFGFVVERTHWLWSIGFAVVCGLVVGFTQLWALDQNELFSPDSWHIWCAVLAVVIAGPLFQAWREKRLADADFRWPIPYASTHNHAWTNVVLWCACLVFMGIVWAMTALLAQLFGLIGISFLQDLIGKRWFDFMLTCGAFGAGVGLLRDRDNILRLLQRVVTTILSVLAPVLAIGLLLFLIALPFTGLHPLWGATKATTPILISCIIGALCLTNGVLGDTDADESQQPLLRYSAMALGAMMLPLAVIAAVSTWMRVHQHGLTPDRLWSLVFIGIALAYGLAYLFALVRQRLHWGGLVRVWNLRLALGLCGMGVLLSTPLIDFGAMSTRDQVARLQDGRTPLDEFDWAALRFKFGAAGVVAVGQLAKSGATPEIKKVAANALKVENPWQMEDHALSFDEKFIILPHKIALPDVLQKKLIDESYNCYSHERRCAIIYHAGDKEAIQVSSTFTTLWQLKNGTWGHASDEFGDDYQARNKAQAVAAAEVIKGNFDVKIVTRRQVYAGGKPVGDAF